MKINTCIVKSVLFNIYSLQENVLNFKRTMFRTSRLVIFSSPLNSIPTEKSV